MARVDEEVRGPVGEFLTGGNPGLGLGTFQPDPRLTAGVGLGSGQGAPAGVSGPSDPGGFFDPIVNAINSPTGQQLVSGAGILGDSLTNARAGIDGRASTTAQLISQKQQVRANELGMLEKGLDITSQMSDAIGKMPAGAERDQALADAVERLDKVAPGMGNVLTGQVNRPVGSMRGLEDAAKYSPRAAQGLDFFMSGDLSRKELTDLIFEDATQEEIAEGKSQAAADKIRPRLEDLSNKFVSMFGDSFKEGGVTNDEIDHFVKVLRSKGEKINDDTIRFVKENRERFASSLPQTDADIEKLREQARIADAAAFRNLDIDRIKAREGLGGNPVFVRVRGSDQEIPAQEVDGRYFVTNEDGSREEITHLVTGASKTTERTQDTTGLAGKTDQELESGIVGSLEVLGRLDEIRESYDPRFLQTVPKLGAKVDEILDRAGIASPEEQENLREFSEFRQKVAENANRTIKEITGAQMSEPEAERLLKQIPNLEDAPTPFRSKMDGVTNTIALSVARSMILRERGVAGNFWDSMSLTETAVLMEAMAEDLVDQLEAEGMGSDAALNQARRDIFSRFRYDVAE